MEQNIVLLQWTINHYKKEYLNNILKTLYPLLQADGFKEDKVVTLNMGEIVELILDPNDIRQLILNLTRNGLEAMQPGGVLSIETYLQELCGFGGAGSGDGYQQRSS